MSKLRLYTINDVLEFLQEVYPNKLPRKRLNDYEQGVLEGHQEVIDRLKAEVLKQSRK